MFDTPPQPPQAPTPLNPIMPAPDMVPPTPGAMPAPLPPTQLPPQPQVHTMPERFRATGGGGPKGSGGTKKLVIILLVVLGAGIVVVGGLYAMNRFLLKNSNTNSNTNTIVNTENANLVNTNATNDNGNTNTDLNTNTITNDNGNTNAVVGGNTNATVNATTNANTNTAVTTNTNMSTNANTNTNTSASSFLNIPSSKDSDTDGLTDVEEAAYGTNPNNPDSDSDTFIDGKSVQADGKILGEVYNGYDPLSTGTLENSVAVKRTQSASKDYSVLAPHLWVVTTDPQNGMLITPTVSTGEFFKVGVNDNASGLTPKQWYLQASPAANVDSLPAMQVNGLEGIVNEDGSTVYLFHGTKVYSIQYGFGSVTQLNYRTTFDMIVRNFKLVAAS